MIKIKPPFLRNAIAIAAIFIATQASADEHSYKEVSGWRIFQNEKDCSAIAGFTDDEYVAFFYDASTKSTSVVFTDRDSTSLEEYEKRNLDIMLLKANGKLDDGWESTEFTVLVNDDDRRVFRSQSLDDPALADFRGARAIGFFYKQKKIASYDLAGSGAALREVERCSQRIHNINPKDVFAGE